jgi:hypothetical protein
MARRSAAAEHPTSAERAERGKAVRAGVPRRSHAAWEPWPTRPDPVSLLEEQAATRIPELVPIRYGRMLASPFAFFRGAALVMAADLAGTPRSGISVQLCGDAHLANFGLFGTPERRLVFDINDFDETLPGPWEWDVKRLAASIAVAARGHGLSAARGAELVAGAVGEYREAMRRFAEMTALETWYAHVDVEDELAQASGSLAAAELDRADRAVARAETDDNLHTFARLTQVVDGTPQIVGDPPLVVPLRALEPDTPAADIEETLRGVLRDYRRTLSTDRRALLEQYRVVDLARKVVGVGSVGASTWIVLLVADDERDPLFLQIKEAQASVLERFLQRSRYRNAGHRVVAGQRLMQSASDLFLGWKRLGPGPDGQPRDFYVRQLHDWKGGGHVDGMRPRVLAAYAQLCGWTLARAHARSGDRVAIAAYLGGGDTFDRAVAEFAETYADQNERDFEALKGAVAAGRVEAVTGV